MLLAHVCPCFHQLFVNRCNSKINTFSVIGRMTSLQFRVFVIVAHRWLSWLLLIVLSQRASEEPAATREGSSSWTRSIDSFDSRDCCCYYDQETVDNERSMRCTARKWSLQHGDYPKEMRKAHVCILSFIENNRWDSLLKGWMEKDLELSFTRTFMEQAWKRVLFYRNWSWRPAALIVMVVIVVVSVDIHSVCSDVSDVAENGPFERHVGY